MNLIELLDHMGDDLAVVNAARVSMAKESLTLCESDEKLIHYLAKHKHWTPFGATKDSTLTYCATSQLELQ